MVDLTSKVQGIFKFLSQGFEKHDQDEDIFEDMINDMDDEYPVDRNLALDPIYGSVPNKNNDFKVVNHPRYSGYEVIVSEPRSYDESVAIVKHLKEKKTIILNLHLLDKDQSIRIVDFLCGATHALTGNQQKISETVFIFTPASVHLSAESQKKKFISDGVWYQPQ